MSKGRDLAEIERELTCILQDHLGFEAPGLQPTDNLFEAGVDSMALMHLLLLIQDEFSVSIPASDLNRTNFATVRSMAQIVQKHAA